jgi:uncharacterized protein YjiS (DUF1127 family)
MPCVQRICPRQTGAQSPPSDLAQRLWPDWLGSITRLWRRMQVRSRQRRGLLELDDHMLADIGMSRREAELEGRKWFWH